MIRLNKTQELEIIDIIRGYNEKPGDINFGASRAVFLGVDANGILQKLNIECDYPVILKTAYAFAGLIQNANEVQTFEDYSKELQGSVKGSFARIAAAGDIFIFMESVEYLEDFWGYNEDGEHQLFSWRSRDSDKRTHYSFPFERDFYMIGTDKDDGAPIFDRVVADMFASWLYEYNNSDAVRQCGFTEDGRMVCYDYGYSDDSDSDQCSDGELNDEWDLWNFFLTTFIEDAEKYLNGVILADEITYGPGTYDDDDWCDCSECRARREEEEEEN